MAISEMPSEEKEEEMAGNGNMVRGLAIGALVGGAIGLAVGLLYAPRSGAETRQMLKEKAQELKAKAASWRSKAAEEMKEEEVA